ncbi:MAG: taurine ABC transporter substrate-binding protein [Candidatus Electrothrix sp. AR4]|nr:taurine ABC transporter substrate-binding protein [Candidatus Electrothrix sp. AR4]
MKKILSCISLAAVTGVLTSTASADVNVAYFLEWATPNQIAKVEKTYDEVIGEKVNWVNFASGGAMTEAMLAGDIDIAYSQGLAPFVNAVNANAPIKMVGIAVAYGAADDCIIRTDSGITKENATELEGKSIAVPLNTMADFGFRMTMQHLGVDMKKLKIVDQEPADAAVSLADKAVVMACGYGENSLSKMKEIGKPMLTTDEKKGAGITSFDIVSVTDKFAQENADAVKRFMEVTAKANADFAKNQGKMDVIAKDAGLTLEKTKSQMAGFAFPTPEEQMSDYFNKGGRVGTMLPFMGTMFATEAAPAKDDYSTVVDTSFLK